MHGESIDRDNMKGVLKSLIDSGGLYSTKDLELARKTVIEYFSKLNQTKDVKKMRFEVMRFQTIEKIQSYIFNCYLKFNKLGVCEMLKR